MKKTIKGLIMSIEAGSAIVLTPKGEFIKTEVVSGQYFVGDEISLTIKEENRFWERVATTRLTFPKPALQLVLSLCLVLAGGVGTWAYPVGHVYMDVNPSLGMSYNLYHRVIGMESFNEDGAKVIQSLSYYGKTIREGLEDTLRAMDAEGYIKTEEKGVSGVLIGYTDPNLEKEFVKSIVETSAEIQKTLQVASVKVNTAAEQIAKEEKGEKDTISPIQATLAAQKLNRQNPENTKDKALKAQLKAEVKAEAKALKEKATLQLIEENQSVLKVVPNPKVEEIKKKNEAVKERIKAKKAQEEKNKEEKNKEENERQENLKEEQIKKEKERMEKEQKDKAPKDKDEGIEKDKDDVKEQAEVSVEDKVEAEIPGDQQAKLQKITSEIARLTALMDQIQNGDGKANQKAAKIKKIQRQIERLKEEAEELQED